jgi:hypothetical protein
MNLERADAAKVSVSLMTMTCPAISSFLSRSGVYLARMTLLQRTIEDSVTTLRGLTGLGGLLETGRSRLFCVVRCR